MKTYFTASLLYREGKEDCYKAIVKTLKSAGHKVIGFDVVSASVDRVVHQTNSERILSYQRFLKWVTACDLMIAEASFPSTIHIGHEISVALEKGKPVIALYQKDKRPFFLSGIHSDKLTLMEYNDASDLPIKLSDTLNNSKEQIDTRFNFFISSEIGHYLDWVSQTRKTPRAVFLRTLLERAMKNDKEFTG